MGVLRWVANGGCLAAGPWKHRHKQKVDSNLAVKCCWCKHKQ
jgi:hypothetical protein